MKKKSTHEPNNKSSVSHTAKLNWLRAAVLGASDGIVSIAGLVVGVASASNSTFTIITAGLAGIVAGAISMAAGEYVSVSSSRDLEKSLIRKEHYALKHHPKEALEELITIYEQKGLSRKTAALVAGELSEKDAVRAHLDAEHNIDPDDLTNPWHAAFASALSFFLGAIIPMIAILLPPSGVRIPVTFISVVIALALAGVMSAKVGDAPVGRATMRVVLGGVLAMIVTYGVGRLFGASGI